jgi:copper chaperone CopZ
MTRRIASVALALALAVLFSAPAFAEQGADETQVFAVEGMTCGLCGKAITKSLRGVEGVSEVRVDQDAEQVTVVALPEVAADSLVTAIEAAGSFTAKPMAPADG